MVTSLIDEIVRHAGRSPQNAPRYSIAGELVRERGQEGLQMAWADALISLRGINRTASGRIGRRPARQWPAFARQCGAKYPMAVKKITDDEDELPAFFDIPAEHWIHLRTTNPIESTFATVRLRTKVTKGAGSRTTGLTMVFSRSSPPRPAGGP